jgi:hypothetical protein
VKPVTLVVPPDVEKSQVQDTTQKFQDMIEAARPNLSDAEFQELEQHLIQYRDIFVMKSGDYGRTDQVCNRIHTGDARPITIPPFAEIGGSCLETAQPATKAVPK